VAPSSPQRNLVGYGEQAPTWKWPGDRRLAVNIVVNFEEGAERSPLDGDMESEALNEASYPVPAGQRDLVQESVYEYGSRTGVWRILRLFDQYKVCATVFACGQALERSPEVAKAFTERDYDFVGHGYRWIAPISFTRDEELDDMRRTAASIRATTGKTMSGWFPRGPHTTNTFALAAQERLEFVSAAFNDDVPYVSREYENPLLVIPYALDTNDIRFWKDGFLLADDFAAYCIDTFDVLYRESATFPRMMSVGLHPRIIGRPGRIAGLQRFLEHASQVSEVWFATRSEIASHWRSVDPTAGSIAR
jgi:allantoinase